MTREMQLYNNRVYGVKVSSYGLEKGYLDYNTLANIVGYRILNNTIRSETMEDWAIADGYEFLAEYTDEIVFYNEKLDVYIWGITHYGTSWDYVLTDIKLNKEAE